MLNNVVCLFWKFCPIADYEKKLFLPSQLPCLHSRVEKAGNEATTEYLYFQFKYQCQEGGFQVEKLTLLVPFF